MAKPIDGKYIDGTGVLGAVLLMHTIIVELMFQFL